MFQGAKLSGPRFTSYFRTPAPLLGARIRNYTLGASDFEWYQRAKAAVANYEELVRRTNEVANQTARNAITSWLGSPNNPTTAAYRYRSVVSDIRTDVEGFTPPNYGAYAVERRQNRVEELEGIVEEFKNKVRAAETEFGQLAPPRTVTVPGAGADLTVPIIGAGIAVAAAIVLSQVL
jgi:hypothetical protein